jgi:hypothetical protein
MLAIKSVPGSTGITSKSFQPSRQEGSLSRNSSSGTKSDKVKGIDYIYKVLTISTPFGIQPLNNQQRNRR